MKFGDKLCKLRKKEGLSQEELGDKLNVTRQTVSKWELGQSRPDTDKLAEICSLFGVNANELMDDNIEITNNNRHIDSIDVKPRKWLLVVLIIVALAISVALINKLIAGSRETDKNTSSFEDNINTIFNNVTNQYSQKAFNIKLESYSGSQYSSSVKYLLDYIITNNKKNDTHQVEVTYKETTTKDPDEIKNMKTNITQSNEYEVSFDYDKKGFIYKATIEEIFKDISSKSFNFFLEGNNGTKYGAHVKEILDRVIESNKKYPNHLINVVYKTTNTTIEEEIISLKSNFKTFDQYEVIINYDDAGYVNEIRIQK